MTDFFFDLLDQMEVFTGIKQMERLQAKRAQLQLLVDECSKAALNFPLKPEIMQKVLFDAMQTDQDFIGLNVKWVRKVLNEYCKVHGVTKDNQVEKPVDLRVAYQNVIDFWLDRKDLDPDGVHHGRAIENYKRAVNGEAIIEDSEGVKIMGDAFLKQISGSFLDARSIESPTGSGTRMRETLEHNGIKNDPKKVSALESACGVTQEMKDKIDKTRKINSRTHGSARVL